MTKKFMVEKFKQCNNAVDYMKVVMQHGEKIRGMEADLCVIDDDSVDFDLTMSCGPYGDEG